MTQQQSDYDYDAIRETQDAYLDGYNAALEEAAKEADEAERDALNWTTDRHEGKYWQMQFRILADRIRQKKVSDD